MSTCQGAPAPHACDHGDRCDWTPPPAAGFFPSLEASLMEKFRARQVRTPARALATIEKLETAGVTELGVPVFVWPGRRGRVTGFFVGCEEHGVMPFLAPSKLKGEVAAKRHIVAEHCRAGSVVHTNAAPKIRVAS